MLDEKFFLREMAILDPQKINSSVRYHGFLEVAES